MKKLLQAGLAFSVLLLLTVVASAETTVTLSKMHLCCGKCVKGVDGAVSKIDGVRSCSQVGLCDGVSQRARTSVSQIGYGECGAECRRCY